MGSIMNSLSPSGPMTDWTGGSAPSRPSLESSYNPTVSKSSSLDGVKSVVDGSKMHRRKVDGSQGPRGLHMV